ncbi:MAG TPA: Gmad2 immunoglobulin-like domain-containing protein [Candidatus Paceibacterota bacterium]|nr:Gmad2 immunoglobulin-like domain-containing protein [Candidatus Paceibacterota bacterium]
MNNLSKGIAIFASCVLLYLLFSTDMIRSQKVYDFESCLAYGNPVMESHPRQCRDKDGVVYAEKIVSFDDSLVRVDFPLKDSLVTSPLVIKGEARGFWFFEASFPISLVDEDGNVLASHYATAEGDWMTEEYVPFLSSLSFSVSKETRGFVVLKKDNPSGDSERDAEVRLPVVFSPKKTTSPDSVSSKKCVVGGCSGQLCSDASAEPLMSTCEYREEYACYKKATCEVQKSTGECGWTQTEDLSLCLQSAR